MSNGEKELLNGQIVIVEDNPAILEILTIALRRCGVKSRAWNNPGAALDYLETNAEDVVLVVSDIDLPGMNGFELCSQVLARRPDMGFIFISGAASISDLDKEGYLERFPFLSKPFRISHFLEVLSSELEVEAIIPGPASS